MDYGNENKLFNWKFQLFSKNLLLKSLATK